MIDSLEELQVTQPQEPTLGDMVIEDLERQLSESDPRYGRKCRELAVLRAQYSQLMAFVQSKKDVLGLTEVGSDGEPLQTEGSPESEVQSELPAKEGPATSEEPAKVNGSKAAEKAAPVS